MTEIKINVTVNGGVDVQKIAEQIRRQIEAATKKEEPLKVGDYARTLAASKYGDVSEGEIVKITETDIKSTTGHIYGVNTISDWTNGIFLPNQLARLSEDEIAEIERKQAEKEFAAKASAKWASINRKPNEFKKGDIVRVIESPHALPVGTIFEVKNVDVDGDIFDHESHMYMAQMNRVELITPVEARFDLAEGDR